MSVDLAKKSEEISFMEFIQILKDKGSYLKTQWLKIAIIGFLGGTLGFIYAWIQPYTYTAKLTFVVEEGKSSSGGLGGLASLAGQFGVDVSGNGGGSVLSGDNILLYFKSEALSREVLLSEFQPGSKKSFADEYIKIHKLKDAWVKNKSIGNIFFPVNNNRIKYTRIQDSLIKSIIENIRNTQFSITKIDKKSSFIEVSATMKSESLAKSYCEKIVERAVDRYVTMKTQRQKATVEKLQIRADSISNLLRQKTISSASLQTFSSTMDINPLFKTGSSIAVETTLRDKTMLATIFASVVQNLELAKFTLSQETPVIQVVDLPILPLHKNKSSRSQFAVTFSIISIFFFLLFLLTKKSK